MISETEENLIERMEKFAKKMETAEIWICDLHETEHADFEPCPACEREKKEKLKEVFGQISDLEQPEVEEENNDDYDNEDYEE